MSHVTHLWMNAPLHTHGRVTPHSSDVWMNESRHTYEWVMSHAWMISFTQPWGHEWAMCLSSDLWMQSHMTTSCHPYGRAYVSPSICLSISRFFFLVWLHVKHCRLRFRKKREEEEEKEKEKKKKEEERDEKEKRQEGASVIVGASAAKMVGAISGGMTIMLLRYV